MMVIAVGLGDGCLIARVGGVVVLVDEQKAGGMLPCHRCGAALARAKGGLYCISCAQEGERGGTQSRPKPANHDRRLDRTRDALGRYVAEPAAETPAQRPPAENSLSRATKRIPAEREGRQGPGARPGARTVAPTRNANMSMFALMQRNPNPSPSTAGSASPSTRTRPPHATKRSENVAWKRYNGPCPRVRQPTSRRVATGTHSEHKRRE